MTPLLAALGFDPAIASPINLVLLLCLVHVGSNFAREIGMLRATVLKQAEELARTARGSETRAENAAAEITRLVAKVEGLLAARDGSAPTREAPR